MELPYEYRCVHCKHAEEVMIQVNEEGTSQHRDAESSLTFRVCPRCKRRDWTSIVLRMLGLLALLHVGVAFLILMLGLAGRTLNGLPELIEKGPMVTALAWAAIVAVTVFFTLSDWASRRITARR